MNRPYLGLFHGVNRPYLQFRRGVGRPGIDFVIGRDDLIGIFAQELAKRGEIQSMMSWSETRQVLICELEQTHRGRQTLVVLRVQWVFESLLKMKEGAGSLDQSLKKIRIARFGFEPQLLQDIVRFVVALFIPAVEKRAVKRVPCNV